MHLTLQRPKRETPPIVAKLLGGQPLEKGEEFEFFSCCPRSRKG